MQELTTMKDLRTKIIEGNSIISLETSLREVFSQERTLQNDITKSHYITKRQYITKSKKVQNDITYTSQLQGVIITHGIGQLM